MLFRASANASPRPVIAPLMDDEPSKVDGAVLVAWAGRNRLAQDVGLGFGAGTNVEASCVLETSTDSGAVVDVAFSTATAGSSEAFDCVDTTESRCALRVAVGLWGKAGMTGAVVGRDFGCVGVCWDLAEGVGTLDAGVVG